MDASRSRSLFAVSLCVTACGSSPPSSALAPAPVALASGSPSASNPKGVEKQAAAEVVWIEDDFARARAEAKRDKKLIFADAWATWCHSCVSMRAYVLHDPMLAPLSDKYVFAGIDTEREANAPFVKTFPQRAWPTLFVIDPESDKVILKWEGSLAADEILLVLRDVQRIASQGDEMANLLGSEVTAEALKAYLAKQPEPGVLRDHLVDRYVWMECATKKRDACSKEALAQLPKMTDGTTKWTVLANALGSLDNASPEMREKVVAEAEKLLSVPAPRVNGDDVSGVFEALCDFYEHSRQKEKTRALATRWATFLEGEAAKATSAAAKSVYDPHRLLAYLALKEPARAIPMLEESAKAHPNDYNPHARLARVYKELGRNEDALREVAEAKKVGYGPRMLRIAALGADIHEQSGDRAGAKRELEETLAKMGDAPLPGSYKRVALELKMRADKLGEKK